MGSEGLTSVGLAKASERGDAGVRCDIGGEAGADTDPEELPQGNMGTKGGGLTARNTLRIGEGRVLWEVKGA